MQRGANAKEGEWKEHSCYIARTGEEYEERVIVPIILQFRRKEEKLLLLEARKLHKFASGFRRMQLFWGAEPDLLPLPNTSTVSFSTGNEKQLHGTEENRVVEEMI